MKREIHIIEASDGRNPDPAKNYGVGTERRIYVLIGDNGAISFCFSTGKTPPSIPNSEPQGYDLSYHAREPVREWQKADSPDEASCCWLHAPCWCDGTALGADELFRGYWATRDEDVIWNTLRRWYEDTFGTDELREAPDA